MDKRDWKLLAKLDVNGRIPITELAKACRVSKETALYRFNKLEREGVLTKHYPFINVYALGYLTIRVYFELQEMTEEKEKEFVSFLDTKTKASFIFRMDNVHKYGILIWAPNIYDIEKKLFALKKEFGELLVSYTLSVFCSYKQYSRNYLFPFDTKRVTVDFRPTKSEEVDKEDLQILKALSADARMSTLEMSRRTGIPQTTISSRIRKLLQRKILLGYRSEIDFIALGFTNFFLELYLKDNSEVAALESWADASKNVVWLQKIIGPCDLEIEVEVKDRKELEQLLNDLRSKFKSIRKINFWAQEYKKATYLPA